MNSNKAVVPFRSREEVRELAERIRIAVPGGRKLEDNEAIALAQVAAAHGLDPFIGEVWYIPGVGPCVGIKGLRKVAAQKAAEEDGNYWTEFHQMSGEEKEAYLIPANALAFRCHLFDSATIRAYAESIRQLTLAGIPYEVSLQIVGERPKTVGVGWWVPGEQTKMKPAQCAMKRAEADALKRRYHIPFGFDVEQQDDQPAIVTSVTPTAESEIDASARHEINRKKLGRVSPDESAI